MGNSTSTSTRRPGRRGGLLYILALQALSEFSQSDPKPPVTASLIAANTLIYLRPGPLHSILPTLSDACLNPHLVVKNKDFKRLFLSAFFHVDETHLVYNMLSLLWKGTQLESTMGSPAFLSMVGVLLGLSHGILVASAKVLDTFFNYPYAWTSHCSVGFSSVLFALKVVLNANSSDYTNVHGVLVPARYAAWAELILIQMFVPDVSFLGHLSGILAGILYLRLKTFFAGSNPLSHIVNKLKGIFIYPFKFLHARFSGSRRIRGHGTVGRRPGSRVGPSATVWRCPRCTYDNMIYLEACQMCDTRQGELSAPPEPSSIPSEPSSSYSSHTDLSVEELRRLRLERFERH